MTNKRIANAASGLGRGRVTAAQRAAERAADEETMRRLFPENYPRHIRPPTPEQDEAMWERMQRPPFDGDGEDHDASWPHGCVSFDAAW